MTATFAKDGMTFVMLASLSSAGILADRTADSFRGEPAARPLGARVKAAARWLLQIPRRAAVINALSGLSDHELADIGLSRNELARVFDGQFNADRACQR